MDRNDPPIIKSGARHSVQIAQGTKNAKSIRNVVTSDADAPLADRYVYADESVIRDAAVLQQGLAHEQLAGTDRDQEDLMDSAAPAAVAVLVDPAASQTAHDQVVVSDDMQSQAQSSGPSMVREERAAQDAQVAKVQPDAEHRILIDTEKAPADTQGVIVEGRRSQENWQRIEQLQAQANRIRLDNGMQSVADVGHAQLVERSLNSNELPPAQDTPQTPSRSEDASAQEPAATVPSSGHEQAALPPEVMGNFDHQAQQAMGGKESALMARLRILKSNMTVTENRLTKLKPSDGSDS